MPDADAVKKWAGQNDMGDKSIEEFCKEPAVKELIKGEIDKYSVDFKGYERVKQFALIGEEFSTENGLLTPSLKLKRRKVIEKYGDVLDGLWPKSV